MRLGHPQVGIQYKGDGESEKWTSELDCAQTNEQIRYLCAVLRQSTEDHRKTVRSHGKSSVRGRTNTDADLSLSRATGP